MEKDTIRKAKEKYTELMKLKEELVEVKKELLEQQPSQVIKDYLQIIEKEQKKIPSEEEILKYCFYNEEQENSMGNIFVFIGAYRHRGGKKQDVRVTDYTKADYFIYQNLEKMFGGMVIYPQEQKQFEQENVILRFKSFLNIIEKFYKLQCIYFREYLNDENISQERVLMKLKENL